MHTFQSAIHITGHKESTVASSLYIYISTIHCFGQAEVRVKMNPVYDAKSK